MAKAPRSSGKRKSASKGEAVVPGARSGKYVARDLRSGKVLKTSSTSKLVRPGRDDVINKGVRIGVVNQATGLGKSGNMVRDPSAAEAGGENPRRAAAIRKIDAAFAGGSIDVLVIPVDDVGSLTSQNVADILNVSRPYVVKLAKTGGLPFQMVGTHHRFRARDVEAYNARMRVDRRAALAAMSAETDYRGEDF